MEGSIYVLNLQDVPQGKDQSLHIWIIKQLTLVINLEFGRFESGTPSQRIQLHNWNPEKKCSTIHMAISERFAIHFELSIHT